MTNPAYEALQAGERNRMKNETLPKDRNEPQDDARLVQPFSNDLGADGGIRDFRAIDTSDYSPNRVQTAFQQAQTEAVRSLEADDEPVPDDVQEDINRELGSGLDPLVKVNQDEQQ